MWQSGKRSIEHERRCRPVSMGGWRHTTSRTHISVAGVKASLDATVPGQRGVGEGANLSGEPWCGLAVCQMNS